MARARTIHVTTDMLALVRNLRDARLPVGANLLSGATVTARVLFIVDQSGGNSPDDPVPGVPDPITLTEESGKLGVYVGTIPDTADLEAGDEVKVIITANAGAGLLRTFRLDAVVEETPD